MEAEAGDIRSLLEGEELHILAEVGSRVGAGTAGVVVVVHNLHCCIPDTQTY